MYPIDAIKVRPPLQSHKFINSLTRFKTRMQILNSSNTPAYSGVIRNTVQIARTEGFFSLWRGMSSVIVGAGESTTSCQDSS